MPAFLKERSLFGTGTGRNLGRGTAPPHRETSVRYTRDFRGKNNSNEKTPLRKTMNGFFLASLPTSNIFSLLPVFSFPFLLSLPLFLVSSFFPSSYTCMPVSRTFDKYLHEFRATARKLEKERGEGRLWNSLGPYPGWSLASSCCLSVSLVFPWYIHALFFSCRFFGFGCR